MRPILWVAVGGLLLMSAADAALYEPADPPFVQIASAGRPYAQIVTPAEPTYLEQFAAAELQGYLQRISGATLPVMVEGEAAEHNYSFLLGATRRAAEAGVEPDEQAMGRDGFALRSIDGGLIIRGRNDLGTLFGVYELLERYFDVRWFMPGEIGEHVPERAALRMGTVDLTFRPSFRVRWVGNGEWPLHQRMNAYVTAGDRDVGVNWKWHFHTFRRLIPPEDYYEEHPEYFALVNGQRTVTDSTSHGNQLCTSNPEVIREVADNLIAVLDAEPGIEIITLSPNDGGGFCECEQCRALDEPGRDWFARYSRRLAIFNNEVAKIVGRAHPDVLIKVGAYAMYARPPLDEDYQPEENLFFQLCHLYFCHNHPLGSDMCQAGETYEPSERFVPNQEFCTILDQWLELSPHLFIYEYYSIGGMQRAKLPWPLVHTIRSDIPYYRDRGVEGFYTQLSGESWHRLGLNFYLAAKLSWNADLDVDALLEDYFHTFYGPAAEPMRDYFMTMEQAMQDWGGCASYGLQGVSGLRSIGPKVFTAEVMRQMGASLAQAERLAADHGLFAERVALARQMYQETQQSLAEIAEE
ncbi:MAG: DUF4838 domain-containing protein [Armatimonadota bacterium]